VLKPLAVASGRRGVSGLAQYEDREFRLKSVDAGQGPTVGRTFGYVQSKEGLYLFPADPRDSGLQRVFVPRSAYCDHQFGPFTEDVPGSREISDPNELLQAIERQRTMPVMPIGRSLLQLGLVTTAQLERALTEKPADVPLGEALVRAGALSRTGPDRALAHKTRLSTSGFDPLPTAVTSEKPNPEDGHRHARGPDHGRRVSLGGRCIERRPSPQATASARCVEANTGSCVGAQKSRA